MSNTALDFSVNKSTKIALINQKLLSAIMAFNSPNTKYFFSEILLHITAFLKSHSFLDN